MIFIFTYFLQAILIYWVINIIIYNSLLWKLIISIANA